jgi:cysteine desulfurase
MPKDFVYLDYAAATPVDESVLKLMQPYFTDNFYNPSATYLPAVKVKQALNQARERVAYWLGAKPNEIILTAGASEANNLAISGIMREYSKANMVYSAIEHESIIAPAKQFQSREVKVDPSGRLDLADLAKQINDQTVLVSIIYASNEIGTIEPINEVSKVIKKVRAERQKQGNKLPLYFHSDATQAANYHDLHASRLGLDLMSLNGGKIYGPKQSGVLFVKSSVMLSPLIYGGGQERGLRSGTENVAGAIGMSSALDLVQSSKDEEHQRLAALSARLIYGLTSRTKAEINGSLKHRLPNNVHITIPGKDNERLLLELETQGILAAAGSACSASNEESSHVLKAIGKTDNQARASIRLSLGRQTSLSDIDRTLDCLVSLLNQ